MWAAVQGPRPIWDLCEQINHLCLLSTYGQSDIVGGFVVPLAHGQKYRSSEPPFSSCCIHQSVIWVPTVRALPRIPSDSTCCRPGLRKMFMLQRRLKLTIAKKGIINLDVNK